MTTPNDEQVPVVKVTPKGAATSSEAPAPAPKKPWKPQASVKLTYDADCGELRYGAKVIAYFYDDNGKPFLGPEEKANTLGVLIADAFNNTQANAARLKAAAKKTSRTDRWADACSRAGEALDELVELQSEYADWHSNLPENLQNSPVGEKLETITSIDIESAKGAVDEAEGAELPRGFGQD